MQGHTQILKNRELEAKKQKLKNMRMSWLLLAATLLGLSMFSLFTIGSTISPKNSVQKKDSIIIKDVAEVDSWELILVNSKNIVPRDFTVDLIPFENTRVDARIADSLQKMIDTAKDEGINLSVCSGFRSVSEQDKLYKAKCLIYTTAGYSDENSKNLASKYLQMGGASEHHTGLAVDLLTDNVSELDEGFAKTPAYTWLEENAAKYGFIERYPKDKSQITGIDWEPWHYRYVGKDNAEAIKSKNLCLEEYLQDMYSKS